MLSHPFAPVYDENSEILILGTFPSVKSRENEFYYGHPQNRFWKMLAAVFKDDVGKVKNVSNVPAGLASVPAEMANARACCEHMSSGVSNMMVGSDPLYNATIDEKIQFLHQHHVALWDVIATCEITGSADASITNATPNDITGLLKKAPIRKICCNGTKSWELFQKYIQLGLENKLPIVKLPSTSPANAVWTLKKLVAAWERELQL